MRDASSCTGMFLNWLSFKDLHRWVGDWMPACLIDWKWVLVFEIRARVCGGGMAWEDGREYRHTWFGRGDGKRMR